MTTTLDVVNSCLATMGEAPLNVIAEPHEFKAAILRKLAQIGTNAQARGWWFNTEELLLTPDPVNSWLNLPGDCLKAESGTRNTKTLYHNQHKPWVVQRGMRMYDTTTGGYTFTEDVAVHIVRNIPFDQLPVVVADYISAEVTLSFQSDYDGDSNKRRELSERWQLYRLEARAEDIRQRKVNMVWNNSTLTRIKNVVRGVRY